MQRIIIYDPANTFVQPTAFARDGAKKPEAAAVDARRTTHRTGVRCNL